MELDGDLATLKTGVVLKLDAPSPMALKDAMDAMVKDHPEPTVPKVWTEDKNREEPNESDPDYRLALMRWNVEASTRALSVFILTGTKEESRPEGLEGPEDDDFRETVEVLRIPLASSRKGRYLQWVNYIAAKDPDDLRELAAELGRRAGTAEEDVQQALDSFRGVPGQPTDNGARTGGPGVDGDRVRREPARPRP